MAEKALTAVNQEACIRDISTRSVAHRVRADLSGLEPPIPWISAPKPGGVSLPSPQRARQRLRGAHGPGL